MKTLNTKLMTGTLLLALLVPTMAKAQSAAEDLLDARLQESGARHELSIAQSEVERVLAQQKVFDIEAKIDKLEAQMVKQKPAMKRAPASQLTHRQLADHLPSLEVVD